MKNALQKVVVGDVRDDLMTKVIYSVDASIYEVMPQLVILPKTKEDIIHVVKIASQEKIPLIPRGAGTGIAGSCLGEGIILDTSRYLNRILEIGEDYVVCEPGVIQDDLNKALKPFDRRLGPETSTGNRATIGGMVAANAAGSHFLHYGNMADHILEVEMILADGSCINLGKNSPQYLERGYLAILEKYKTEIAERFPKIKRRASGYQIDSPSLSRLVAGSEGTLGIITSVKLRTSPILKETIQALLCYETLEESLEAVPTLLSFKPVSLELIDSKVVKMGKLSPTLKDSIHWLPQAEAFLLAEFATLPPNFKALFPTQEEKKALLALRKAGLGLLLSRREYSRAIAFIEDVALPPEHLAAFVRELKTLLAGREVGIYGHAGDGCLHIRPFIDLRKKEEVEEMISLQHKVMQLVAKYSGVMSGEHGDGLVRTWLNRELFGDKIFAAFQEVKALFDPQNLMNPGKIVGVPNPKENLRISPQTKQMQIPTYLNFDREGGFNLAVDLCNGNGECRKKTTLMCPSFQGLSDERLTTRARAQALRSVINGKIPSEEFTGDGLYDVLDLCLECKGCKKECPSQVDMAKMKSEFLYHYHKKNGLPIRSRAFGNIGKVFEIGSIAPQLFNFFADSSLSKALLGISGKRSLPKLAKKRFSKFHLKKQEKEKKVVLFVDTFTEFCEPEIGCAAHSLLTHLDYEVITPSWHCCGRPLLSKGMLPQARAKALHLINLLFPYASRGIPIIGLEPSCLYTLKEDIHDVVTDNRLQVIENQLFMLDEFLISHSLKIDHPSLLIHEHCHKKACGTSNLSKLLPESTIIPSGCCGGAGSFGFEKEHYELSMSIGEKVLFPAIREAPPKTILVADGFSCRHQIEAGTAQKPLHLAQVLNSLIKD